jgi:hypothetical protein
VFGRREAEHLVARFDDGVAVRDDGGIAPVDRRDAGIDAAQVFAHRLDLTPDQRPAAHSAHGHHGDPALAELDHLQCFREGDQRFR